MYIKTTDKSVDQAAADVEAAAQRQGFGVLHAYDFKAILHSKGFDLPNECRVLEICSPVQANRILHEEMKVNMALPCRVSIYEDAGRTRIGTIPPTALLGLVSQSEDLSKTAREVEQAICAIIDESV